MTKAMIFKRTGVWATLLWCLMVLIIVVNWETLRTRLWKTEIKEKSPASSGQLRRPISGESNAYQTMQATRSPDSAKLKFPVHVEKGAEVEFGLVRISDEYGNPGEYAFSVYEMNKEGKRKLLETSGEFSTNSWKLFRTNAGFEKQGSDTMEILYVLKPGGLKGKIASVIARAKGQQYYKDFAFLVPKVIKQRNPGELNVILISFDTLRSDHLGCFGYTRPTSPHIDSFAQQNILFTQAITPAPWTLPTHFSLFTGLYPSAHMGSYKGGFDIHFYADRLMAESLRNHGYYTLGITSGGQLASSTGIGRGFDRYIEFTNTGRELTNAREASEPSLWKEHEGDTRKIFETALNWLEEHHNKKFFMFLHTYECHDPYVDTYFLTEKNKNSFIEQRKALYDGDIRYADAFFGKLVQSLKSLDLLSSTIVVFVSDHGDDFYDHYTEHDLVPPKTSNLVPQISNVDHGHSIYDEVIMVPVIFHLPGLKPPKTVLKNQIRLIDVMPTILDYLGISYRGPVQGKSLLQLIKTGEWPQDPPAISEFILFGPEQKSVRMNGYKYIYTEDPNDIKNSRTFSNIPRYALFDLKNDPREKDNIYSQNTELAKEYHRILEETLEESSAILSEVQRSSPPTDEKSMKLEPDVVDALKALGYME